MERLYKDRIQKLESSLQEKDKELNKANYTSAVGAHRRYM